MATDRVDALFAGLPQMLDVATVAELLDLSKAGIYRWLNLGVISGYRLGKTWFIPRDDLKDQFRKGHNLARIAESAPASAQSATPARKEASPVAQTGG